MIQLPNGHVASADIELVDRGGTMVGTLGGDEQRIDRIGTKFSVEFTLRPLTAEQARIFVPRLLRATREMGLIKFPQPGIVPQTVGDFAVSVAEPANSEAIWIKSNNAADIGRLLLEGQAIEFRTGGFSFIHMVTADIAVQNDLAVRVGIFPPLRRSFQIDDAAVVYNPQIQGYPQQSGGAPKWSIDVARMRGLSFSITEAH